LVDVSAGHAQRGVVRADGFCVWPVQHAAHLAFGVVVKLDLAHAELIGPGPVAGSRDAWETPGFARSWLPELGPSEERPEGV